MVLFGIAVRRFVFCFVFSFVKLLTVLGGLYCPMGGGVHGLWGRFVVCLCLCLEVARSRLVGKVTRKNCALNVWCWWCCGRTSENQANLLASMTPVFVVFQKRPFSYISFGMICLGCSLSTVTPWQQLKLS